MNTPKVVNYFSLLLSRLIRDDSSCPIPCFWVWPICCEPDTRGGDDGPHVISRPSISHGCSYDPHTGLWLVNSDHSWWWWHNLVISIRGRSPVSALTTNITNNTRGKYRNTFPGTMKTSLLSVTLCWLGWGFVDFYLGLRNCSCNEWKERFFVKNWYYVLCYLSL